MYFGIFSQLSVNFVILWVINTIFFFYTMQHVLCLYVLFWNWHQWTDTPNNWHSVSIWPWQYFRLCSTLVPYPLGYLCRVHPIPVEPREIETHIKKGFHLGWFDVQIIFHSAISNFVFKVPIIITQGALVYLKYIWWD